jgi:hypothetical protein
MQLDDHMPTAHLHPIGISAARDTRLSYALIACSVDVLKNVPELFIAHLRTTRDFRQVEDRLGDDAKDIHVKTYERGVSQRSTICLVVR